MVSASPAVSSIPTRSMVKSLAFTSTPWLPLFCPAKERTVLSIPLPRSVTPFTVSERVRSKWNLPAGKSITSPGLAAMSRSCKVFWKLPGLALLPHPASIIPAMAIQTAHQTLVHFIRILLLMDKSGSHSIPGSVQSHRRTPSGGNPERSEGSQCRPIFGEEMEARAGIELEPLCGRERVAAGDEWETAGEILSLAKDLALHHRARRRWRRGPESNLSRFAGVNESPLATSGRPQAKS